ncbi:MAG: protein-L-isoaspartate(D-aspartate) O-methyltransferase [Dehalococcoidia bacterium]|nr:protein-L-isoaspartate(D-aspartate) O-methyltransferase [Dehalococcoidia bacterium]
MAADPDETLAAARETLVRGLRPDISDERVLAAIASVARERFVAAELREVAYQDRPLQIGHGQTISQPRMIAMMLQELALTGTGKVLEVGTGSGYQTALLAELADSVVSVELIPELAEGARAVLEELGYASVRVHIAGEVLGWPDEAPYDAIIVAAAAPRIPQSLVDQLAAGGRLALPVGSREEQDLLLAQRLPEGVTIVRKGPCRFVPLIGPEAYTPAEIAP